jgi:hypothetical protein
MEGLIRETSLDGLSTVRYDGACSVEVAEYKTVATDGIHCRCHICPGTRVIYQRYQLLGHIASVLWWVHTCNVTAYRNLVTLQVSDTTRSYELKFHPVPHGVVTC